jgi:cytochrome b pre-mRNA-processing protein 3
MGLIARLLGTEREEPELGALWRRIIDIAREPGWYRKGGAVDSVSGRFDVLSLVLALVLLRMEGDPALRRPASRLTEHFIADMDGQLRQDGIGDPGVGKRITRLMSVLGGRLEVFRAGLAASDGVVLAEAVRRNVTLIDGAGPQAIAAEMRVLAAALAALPDKALLAGEIAR